MTQVTVTSGELSVTFFDLPISERPLCDIGLQMLERALKRAERALTNVNLPTGPVLAREEERARLATAIRENSPTLALGVPVALVPTLRVAVALHYHRAKELVKEAEELTLEAEEAQKRVRQLGRLLARIDVEALGREAAE